jgi:hypothetical protein
VTPGKEEVGNLQGQRLGRYGVEASLQPREQLALEGLQNSDRGFKAAALP